MSDQNCPCAIVFRYWRNGRLNQLKADCSSIAGAKNVADLTAKECRAKGLDWLAEILPYLGEPIVSGSRFGLEHRRDLF
jgi:hypothetical protein